MKILAFEIGIERLHMHFVSVTMEQVERSHRLTVFHC